MLVSMDKILNKAAKEGYGVVAPNVFNAETVEAAYKAAIEAKSPLIMDCAGILDLELISEVVRFFSKRYPEVTAALNLDHGKDYEVAVKAIRNGFTSIMVDRSTLPFEENVKQVAEVVKMAHAVGVSVESELGHVGQGVTYDNDRDAGLTNVDEAVDYINQTGVDCLAVSVGTAHGRYIGTPHIDFNRLAELKAKCSVPLVLHGGSSSGDDNLRKAVEIGIAKVNIGTDLRTAGAIKVKENLVKAEFPNLAEIYADGTEGYKEMLKHYMMLFGCANRERT
mgnify:CR=1 FL=1|jgi:fructose-bisphosphate aldolase class II